MAKQLNVDLKFNADTSKAKQSINELQQAIQKLGYSTMPKNIVDPEAFKLAAASARELSYHLQNAYNSKTGNLDLSKLSSSLKSSNTNLAELTKGFSSAGQVGQQAFLSLAKSIAAADQPSLSLNTHLSTLWITLKNVARFQLTSSIIHGLSGGIQTAFHYAQDLNESLNNIRMVTGQSVEQMANFAKEANEAARSLSTSTLKYTDAALIYYQQGLSDQDVKARTDVTVKLANVSRQSAEEVSSQMTAIWNNFNDGSKSLEYYADVITKLGASTASSSDEIAVGLEKFAAVADTVGLSYEKATAALATVVAETRQSADVVGTAFKTMFARFQGLSLGETLEDGVDLNKYSKALKTIGVEILDANGELKKMDEILDETYQHWQNISEGQRVALAETVAGTRQYAQFMAIMNNYDKILSNQELAAGSSGALQKQADIYAESWEAARDRVKAAAESVYKTLIDEKFFIGIDNIVEYALGGLAKFIENFGGVKALLTTVFSFVLSMVSSKIGPAIQKVIQDVQILTGGANKVYTKMQNEFTDITKAETNKFRVDEALRASDSKQYVNNLEYNAELAASNQLLLAKTKLSAVNDKLSTSEKMRAQVAISGFELQAEQIEETIQQIKKLQQEVDKAAQKQEESDKRVETAQVTKNAKQAVRDKDARNVQQSINSKVNIDNAINAAEGNLKISDKTQGISELIVKIKDANGATAALRSELGKTFLSASTDATKLGGEFSKIFTSISTGVNQDNLADKQTQLKFLQKTFQDLFKEVEGGSKKINDAFQGAFSAKTPNEFATAVRQLGKVITQSEIPADKLSKALKALGANPQTIDRYVDSVQKLKQAENDLAKAEADAGKNSDEYKAALERVKEAEADLQKQQEALGNSISSFNPTHTITALEGITKAAATAGQIVTVYRSISSAIKTWSDESASAGEKIATSLIAVSMVIPAVIGVINNLKAVSLGIAGVVKAEAISRATNIASLKAEQAATITNILVKNKQKIASKEIAVSALLEQAGIDKATAATIEQSIADGTLVIANKGLELSFKQTAAAAWASLGPYALIAGAITGLIILIVKLSQEANKEQRRYEELKKVSEDLNNSLSDQQSIVTDLKDRWEALTSAQKRLKDLTEGTSEWNQQLQETNDLVLELLNKYPKLMPYLTFENNQMSISEEGYNELFKSQQQYLTVLTNANYGVQQDLRKQQYKASMEKFNNTNTNDLKNTININAIDSNNPNQAATAQYIVDLLQSQNIKSQNDIIAQMRTLVGQGKIGEHALTDSFIDELTQYWANYQSEFAKYFTVDNHTADINLSRLNAQNLLQGNTDYNKLNSTDQNAIATIVAQTYREESDNIVNKEEYRNAKGELITGADLKQMYADYKGINLSEVTGDEKFWARVLNEADITDRVNARYEENKKTLDNLNPAQKAFIYGDTNALAQIFGSRERFKSGFSAGKPNETLMKIMGFESKEDWDNYIEQLYNTSVSASTKSLDSIQKNNEKINKAFSKLNFGDTVSPEDYELLSDSAKTYFQEMEDGTFKLIGDAEQFKSVLFQEKISGNLDNLQQIQQTQVKNAEWGTGLSETDKAAQWDNAINAAMAATSLDQLNYLMEQFNELSLDAEIKTAAYNESLLNLGSMYDSCTDEVQAFNFALNSGNEALEQRARDTLKAAISTAQLAKQMGLSTDDIEDQAHAFELKGKAYGSMAQRMAVLNQSLNKGVATLTKNWKDWNKAIKAGDKTSMDYIDAIQGMRDALKELVGIVDDDFIPKDFFDSTENLENMEKAATGDIEAINALGIAIAEANIQKIENPFDDLNMAATLGLELESAELQFEQARQTILNGIADLKNGAYGVGDTVAGMGNDWVAAMNQMAIDTQMSVAEMQSMLNALGLDANVETQTVPITQYVRGYTMVAKYDGEKLLGYDVSPGDEVPVSGHIEVASINGDVKVASRGSAAPSAKSAGGGGGGQKHTVKTSNPEEHRYSRVENAVEGLSNQYDRLSKSRARAWGADKLNIMDSEIAKLKQLKNAYGDYLKEIAGDDWEKLVKKIQAGGLLSLSDLTGGYLAKDYNSLVNGSGTLEYAKKNAAGEEIVDYFSTGDLEHITGVDVQLGENGKIANKDELLTALDNYLKKEDAWWNGLTATEQADEENAARWTRIGMLIDYFKDAIDQYDETVDKFYEQTDNFKDVLYQIQDLNFDKWQTELDIEVDLNESQLKRLETAARILGDSVYKTVEVMKNLFSANNKIDSQYSTFLNRGKEYEEAYKNAQALYEAEEISQDQFIQAVQTARDGIYEVIDSLLDMNEKMRQFYSDTIDGAVEELRKLTDQMAHHVEIMEHLKNLLSLTGKEFDYKSMETVLKATVEMERNALEESTAEYKMFQEQADNARKTYQELLNNPAVSEEAAREFKEAVLDPAIAQAREAENKMYEDAEAYLESVVELYKNTLDKIMAAREDALTKGLGWDFLADSMERAKAVQEEYLTKTNQIYETNTLLRKLAQDIDKTDSVAAKTKLKNFSTEIEQMQKQEKLNQSDLDIAKARYELLLAQIALEEAQNAKSIVRLQRDSEGNYGYVYTADQDKINDAEQNFADKQNDLYNLVLGQANDYGEKITQIEREKYEALQQLAIDYQEGRITTQAEFDEKYLQTAAYYDDLLEAQRHSYYTALDWLDEVATTDHREAWTTAYKDIIDAGENYKQDTIDTFTEIKSSMIDLDSARKEVTDNTSLGLNDLKEKTDTLKRANEQLKNELISNTIPTMGNLLTSVSEVTAEWALQYDQIMAMIRAYMQLAAAMDMAERNAATQYDFSNVSDFSSEMQKEYANNGFSARFYALGDARNERGTSGYLSNDELSTLFTTAQQKGIDLSGKYFTRELYNEIVGMASGGYTGEWGSDGKLAILHEKELVLGAEDTANILATIDLVRQISSAIDLRAAASSVSTGLNSPSFGGLDQTLEQEVTIHAEFPNATDHTEIEEAFNNLINRATQYAARPSNITYKTPRV